MDITTTLKEQEAELIILGEKIVDLGIQISDIKERLTLKFETVEVLQEIKRGDVIVLNGRRCLVESIVNFAGEPGLVGCFVDIRVTEALPNSLRGELVEGPLERSA